MDRKIICSALAGLILMFAVFPAASAGDKKAAPQKTEKSARAKASVRKGKKGKEAPKDTTKTKSKYEKLLEKPEQSDDGVVSVRMKKGKVYLEIPDSLLGRTFVMSTTISAISDNTLGLVGAKPARDLKCITFTKVDSSVFVRPVTFAVTADDAGILSALAKSNIGAIEQKLPVKAKSPSGASVVDATEWLMGPSDDFNLFKFYIVGGYKYAESYKKDLSYPLRVKAFDDNFSFTASRSYTYTATNPRTMRVVRKNASCTAEVTTSFLLLPEKTYHPRMADPRIGFFDTERQVMGDYAHKSRTLHFVNRWRLEPSDTAAYRRGELVEPVRPITYYIDSDFPAWWKPYIVDAVEQWNEVFEEAGFKNAVRAIPFPEDDPDFDPDNIRYSCIRYVPIGIQNAMGPSWVDPRSGEIINASVWVFHDVIKLLSTWVFVQTAQADEDVRTAHIPQEVLGDALMYVIKHEVGHTLGLMHNMGASNVIPLECLRDPAFTQENGTTMSIMDYARFNYVAQPGDKERGVKLTPPRFGKYDRYAIKWGYTPLFDQPSFEEETALTTRWITDSLAASPVYRYGIQMVDWRLFDPRNQTEDLSDDVFGASDYGRANLKYIMARFQDWIADEDDPDYEFRTDVYMGLVNQYLRYAGHVLYNIGGLYRNQVLAGDGQWTFRNIPRQKQLRALDYLFGMMDDLDWMEDKAVLGRLPIAGSPVSQVRASLLGNLMLAPFMAMTSDGVDTYELSPSEVLDRIWDYVWKPTVSGKKLSAAERRNQELFVSNLMTSGSFAMPGAKSSLAEEAAPAREDDSPMGIITYDAVSGFSWTPRVIINSTSLTQATLYAYLTKSYEAMKKRVGGASDADKAHYRLLMAQIDYSVR